MATNYSDLYYVNNSDNKYFRCDTTKVASGNRGGRLFSLLPTTAQELPNGIFGYMGDYMSGEKETRELVVPTSALIKAKIPVLIANPEINYWEVTKSQAALGMYRNRSGQVLRGFPLVEFDEITLSADYFDTTGKTGSIAVGDIFVLQPNLVAGTQLQYASSAPVSSAAYCYFKVTEVETSWYPNFFGGNGTLFPNAYNMYVIQVVLA